MRASRDVSMSRRRLVESAQRFLLNALPLRQDETAHALDEFVEDARTCPLTDAEREPVLLRCLRVLNRRTGSRLPTLVDEYLSSDPRGSVDKFAACVRNLLPSLGIGDPTVRSAIAMIDDRYVDAGLRQKDVADALRTSPSMFALRFGRTTGTTFTRFLQRRRLDEAAMLLVTTSKSVKEIWTSIGFGHASNFTHDFKRRFGMTPREYRTGTVRAAADVRLPSGGRAALALECAGDPVTRAEPREAEVSDLPAAPVPSAKKVLIVDDDEGSRTTIATFLRLSGYTVSVAASGADGLRAALATSPDGIVLDYHLPDMDALTFLRILRQDTQNSMRVAVFTADWDVYDEEAELSSLDACVASKLCDLEDVDRLVTSLVT